MEKALKSTGTQPDFLLEQAAMGRYGPLVAGVDEAGRGPWAGPVVAAAVILQEGLMPEGLNDSKALSPSRREALFDEIMACSMVGVGVADVARIDRDNILAASLWAMAQAVDQLPEAPRCLLVDGNKLPDVAIPAEAVVKGDARSLSIAAASIIAKVTRDRMMQALDADFPQFGWAQNKGYGTLMHRQALQEHGVSPHHRRSFKPVRVLLSKEA